MGDLGLIPGSGRSLGEGKGSPFQYSGLGNFMDCIVHGVAKSGTWLRDFHFHFLLGVASFVLTSLTWLSLLERQNRFPVYWVAGLISSEMNSTYLSYHSGQAGYIISRLTLSCPSWHNIQQSTVSLSIVRFFFFLAALGLCCHMQAFSALECGLQSSCGSGFLTTATAHVAELGPSLGGTQA